MTDPIQSWLHGYINDPAFLSKYRYYAAVLARFDPIDDPGVQVMAVSAHGRRFYLHVNVDFFVNPPSRLQYLRGVLLHEMHHVVLGHLSHPKFRQVAHPDLMELAMEMSANEHIREPLPGHPVRWQDFTVFGVAAGQSTMERYTLLVQARSRGKVIACPAFLDSHLPSGVGRCGGDPTNDPGLHPRLTHLVSRALAEAGEGHGLLAGRDPGFFLEELFATSEEPQEPMDWKAAIQMFVGLIRTPRHTYTRPNRRFPHLVGVVPGRVYYPGPGEKPSLIVALDTSGSMTSEELAEIARQLRPLSALVKMTVVECDVTIQRVSRFEGVLRDVKGRGGTDLRPIYEPEFLRKHRPDGVIYFTDGFGPYPAEDPGIKTLWVLSKPPLFSCPWGTKVCMPRSG